MIGFPIRTLLPVALLFLAAGLVRAHDAFPRGQLPEGIAPTHYTLELTIDPRKDGFTGRASIDVAIEAPTRVIWLHGLGLTDVETRVETGGEAIAATYTVVEPITGVVRLDLEREVAAGLATLRFSYGGRYQEGAEGLFLAHVGEDRYVYSQLESIDARRVFPGFDEPRFKTPFDVTVVAPVGDVVATNTPQIASEPAGEDLLAHRFQTTLPLPTYLLAFAVGPLDVVEAAPIPANEIRDRPLPLRGLATRGQGPRLAFALANTASMVAGLERYFGLPFPYPKLDLIATPSLGGAMENAGAIVYDDYLLLLDDDAPPSQLRAFGDTHAHELAHQWFGDLVTPSWWEDTWLNESFASWMADKIAMQWRPQLFDGSDVANAAFRTMDQDSRAAGRPIRETVTDSQRIRSTFDSITYLKGGGVLAMFESYLGEETFQAGVRLHLQRHLHATANSDQFFEAMADASGQPKVVDAFRSFVGQPGVPLVSATLSADGRTLELSQSRYQPIGVNYTSRQAWKIPVCVSIEGETGAARRCVLLDGPEGKLSLPPGTTVVMPNADGAGYYRFALDDATLDALLAISSALPDRDALALLDSVAAAFRAGKLSFERLVTAAREFAAHPNRRVATGLSHELVSIRNRWAGPEERNALSGILVDIYAPQLELLGMDPRAGAYAAEDPERRLRRTALADILAIDGQYATTVAILLKAAERSLEEPGALDPEFRVIAWTVGVRGLGPGFVAAMKDRVVNSPDSSIRLAAASALGAADRPSLSADVLALTTRPGVGVNEMASIAFGQVGYPASRDTAWTWLQDNFERFSNKLPGFAQEFAYALPASFCDSGHRETAAKFMEQAAARSPVSPLRIAQTLESIDLCVAQRAALGQQVSDALRLAEP
jgi:aminopeptidase N